MGNLFNAVEVNSVFTAIKWTFRFCISCCSPSHNK